MTSSNSWWSTELPDHQDRLARGRYGAVTHADSRPTGALVVECRLASTTPDGREVELVHVASLIRVGDRGIKCHFGIDGDASAATAVCRSLRP